LSLILDESTIEPTVSLFLPDVVIVNVLPAETIDPPAIQREEICVIM
jgi:hypothetical protein